MRPACHQPSLYQCRCSHRAQGPPRAAMHCHWCNCPLWEAAAQPAHLCLLCADFCDARRRPRAPRDKRHAQVLVEAAPEQRQVSWGPARCKGGCVHVQGRELRHSGVLQRVAGGGSLCWSPRMICPPARLTGAPTAGLISTQAVCYASDACKACAHLQRGLCVTALGRREDGRHELRPHRRQEIAQRVDHGCTVGDLACGRQVAQTLRDEPAVGGKVRKSRHAQLSSALAGKHQRLRATFCRPCM